MKSVVGSFSYTPNKHTQFMDHFKSPRESRENLKTKNKKPLTAENNQQRTQCSRNNTVQLVLLKNLFNNYQYN